MSQVGWLQSGARSKWRWLASGLTLVLMLVAESVSTVGNAATQEQSHGEQAAEQRQLPFLRLELSRHRLYVGEQAPIQIKAYLREGTEAHMEGALRITSDAFTASNLNDQPTRDFEVIGDDTWTVFTWTSVLGAIKSGEYPLEVELPLLVRLRLGSGSDMTQRLRAFFGGGRAGGFAGDDLDTIFGHRVERHLILKPPQTALITVLPLPRENRPADFSGAVGQFKVEAAIAPRGVLGDPLNLTVTVSGTGSLASMDTPGVVESAQWRGYRPTAQLKLDATGLSGNKTFTQPVVPQASGRLQVPPIQFSWFDPWTAHYVSQQTPSLAVMVAPAVAVAATTAGATALDQSTFATPVPRVRPRAGRITDDLRPIIREPWFLTLLTLPPLVLLLLISWRPVKQRRECLSGVMRGTAQASLMRMDAAIAQGNTADFFAEARQALEAHPPADEGAWLKLRETADQVAYAGGSLSPESLYQWRQQVARLLGTA